jgi:hypothetical protein
MSERIGANAAHGSKCGGNWRRRRTCVAELERVIRKRSFRVVVAGLDF